MKKADAKDLFQSSFSEKSGSSEKPMQPEASSSYPFNSEKVSQSLFLEEPEVPYGILNFDLISLSRHGILKKYLLQLSKKLSFTMHELAKVLHISERTLQRYHAEDPLSSEASERAILLAQLYHRGIEVFGSAENFNDWLRTPLPAFEQQAPLHFLDTSFGFQLVLEELGRIEHGVFA